MDQGTDRGDSPEGVDAARVVDLQRYRDRAPVDEGNRAAARALQNARLAHLPPGDPEPASGVVGGVAGRAARDWRQIVSWESAADLKLEAITGDWSRYKGLTIEEHHAGIGRTIDLLVVNYFNEPVYTLEELDHRFRTLGCHALGAWSEFTNQTLTSLTSWTLRQLAEKQACYGKHNILRFGARGLIVRASDKRERLENMWRTGHKSMIEPIEDTYMDLLGYSVIALMLTDNVFDLPLEKDA